MKKLLTILASLCMVLALTACSGGSTKTKTPAELIVGKWDTSIAVADRLLDELGADEEMAAYFDFSKLKNIDLLLEFKEDGTLTGYVNADEFIDSMCEVMVEGMRALLIESGVGEEYTSLSDEELLEIIGLDTEAMKEELADEYNENGTYRFEGDSLFIDDDELAYRFDGNDRLFLVIGDEEIANENGELEFVRK